MIFYLGFLFVVAFLYYGVRNYNYWRIRGVKHDLPLPYFGNSIKQFMRTASMAAIATEVYNKYPEEKVVGFYRTTIPELIIRDPELIKRILVTDFYSFYARGLNSHKTVIEPLLKNLFFADGDLWRLIRQRFTPAFSTKKLKAMFGIITERAEKLQTIAEDISNKEYHDMCELMSCYTTDCIGACGLGVNMDSMTGYSAEIRKLGSRIFERKFRDCIVALLKYTFPETFKNWSFLCPKLEKSMISLIKTIIEQRNLKPNGNNNFIDIMLELKRDGNIVGESIEMKNADGSSKIIEIEVTNLIIVAQLFVFFGAGFETSSTATSYTLHQLAYNPYYQEIVHKEIDEVLDRHDYKITYESIKEMKYLEMAFYESMRIYPSVGFLYRTCTAPEYTFPGTNLTITQDVKIMIPIQAIHRDEKYFHKPEKFDPKRFELGINEDKNKYVYLPFGEGPRKCVAEKLGMMQSIAGLVAILQKFTVEPAACSIKNPKPEPTGSVTERFADGLPLKLKKRSSII